MEHWATIAAERRALADQLDTLDDGQWATPSLCGAWTVRDVAAHLVVPHKVKLPSFLVTLTTARFSFDRANEVMTSREAVHPPEEIVADIRRYAEGRFAPPGLGSIAPLTDVLVHGQDIRVPLGLATDGPVEHWAPSLDFVVSKKARRGFVGKALPPLRFAATDLDWSHGEGSEEAGLVSGPAIALALALLGRPALIDQLTGPGVPALQNWIAR
jgi:uncharacterized protein (TIGR03083 family)